MDVNVTPFEIEMKTHHGDMVRGCLPSAQQRGPVSRSARRLALSEVIAPSAAGPSHVPFIEYGPMQLYSMRATPMSRWTRRAWADPQGCGTPFREAIHDMIEHVAGLDWPTGKIGMIGMSHYCWSQWNAARTQPPHLTCLGADARTTGLEPHQAGPADRPAQHGLQRGLAVHNPRRNHDTAYFLQRKGRYTATIGRNNPGCCRFHLRSSSGTQRPEDDGRN